jgi:hypothetical protein
VLRGCLMNDTGPDVRPILRGPSYGRDRALLEAVELAIGGKPRERVQESSEPMHCLGG